MHIYNNGWIIEDNEQYFNYAIYLFVFCNLNLIVSNLNFALFGFGNGLAK